MIGVAYSRFNRNWRACSSARTTTASHAVISGSGRHTHSWREWAGDTLGHDPLQTDCSGRSSRQKCLTREQGGDKRTCPNVQAFRAVNGDTLSAGQAAALGGATVWPAILPFHQKLMNSFWMTCTRLRPLRTGPLREGVVGYASLDGKGAQNDDGIDVYEG